MLARIRERTTEQVMVCELLFRPGPTSLARVAIETELNAVLARYARPFAVRSMDFHSTCNPAHFFGDFYLLRKYSNHGEALFSRRLRQMAVSTFSGGPPLRPVPLLKVRPSKMCQSCFTREQDYFLRAHQCQGPESYRVYYRVAHVYTKFFNRFHCPRQNLPQRSKLAHQTPFYRGFYGNSRYKTGKPNKQVGISAHNKNGFVVQSIKLRSLAAQEFLWLKVQNLELQLNLAIVYFASGTKTADHD